MSAYPEVTSIRLKIMQGGFTLHWAVTEGWQMEQFSKEQEKGEKTQ